MNILRSIFVIIAVLSITFTIAILAFFFTASDDTGLFKPQCGNFYSTFANRNIQFPNKIGVVSKNSNLIYDRGMAHSDFDDNTTVYIYTKGGKTELEKDIYGVIFQLKERSKLNIDTTMIGLEQKYGQKFQKKQYPYDSKDKYYYHLKPSPCVDLIVNINDNLGYFFPKSNKKTSAFVGFYYGLSEKQLNSTIARGGVIDNDLF
jgi:hypothetical protein